MYTATSNVTRMIEMYEEILSAYSNDELLHICKYLNKDYNIYDTEIMRWKKIEYAFHKTTKPDILVLKEKVNSNEFINYLLMRFYNCERVIKYHFIKHLKDAIHDIVAFEVSIGDSRIDICRINGKLCAYEIKTEYDNYDRLKTQMKDYMKAFEKVYVIVPAKNYEQVQNFIPLECGIITYKRDNNFNMTFCYRKAAVINNCDIEFCINSLSSVDIVKILKSLGAKPLERKAENKELLLNISRKKNIWSYYRNFLKNKYKEQWNYLKDNFEKIVPIDCQTFFSSRIKPDMLYERK